MKNNKKKMLRWQKLVFKKLESALEASKLSYLRIYFPLEDLISTYIHFFYTKKRSGYRHDDIWDFCRIFVTHWMIFCNNRKTHDILETTFQIFNTHFFYVSILKGMIWKIIKYVMGFNIWWNHGYCKKQFTYR